MSGTCKKTYQGHVNTKYSLGGTFGVSNGEAFIVSGSEDGGILFWDVKTKDVVQRLEGHEGPVCWVDQCPVTGKIASAGLDGTVRIWIQGKVEDSNVPVVAETTREEGKDDEFMMDLDNAASWGEALLNGDGGEAVPYVGIAAIANGDGSAATNGHGSVVVNGNAPVAANGDRGAEVHSELMEEDTR